MSGQESVPIANSFRIPPNDTEAEQAVLSCMLMDREAISVAHETLRGEDFYRPDNKAVYETMLELFMLNVPVDIVTLNDKLVEKGILDIVGGRTGITTLAAAYYTSANIKHYIKIVEEKATLRRLIKTASEISANSYEAREEIDVILEHAEKSIFDIAQRRNITDFSHVNEILLAVIHHVEQISQTKGRITGVETGFIDFDNKTAGLQPSDLILIGSRP
ncbi:MAG: replicative DNA helicase, partial [Defluviitaleaceae bacterium]|nr:replicative DNA helicase [Defluviitaleaceae bacterium]